MLVEAEQNVSEADFTRVCDAVYRHCGINLRDGKQSLVHARLAKRLRASRFESLTEYLDQVLADAGGREFTALIDALSTNLTSFYREPDHFRFLVDTALPQVLSRKAARGDRRLRLWSAGCSTGEEAYTLAMTLLDSPALSDRSAASMDVKILATDISTNVLRTAWQGFYAAERLDTLPAGYKARFFRPAVDDDERGFTVAPDIQQMIAFRYLNLMEEWPFTGPFDFIFCRNVMIYFDKPTQQRLVNRFHDVLAPGGVLFTGHSESLTGVDHPFRYIRPTVYGKE